MLLMVTSRRKVGGTYGDEEKANFRYDYLYNYLNGPIGSDGFANSGKRGFETALLQELHNLKNHHGIDTPKVGLYLHGYNNDWQESIDELVDLHQSLSSVIGYAPVLVGFSWPSSGRTLEYLSDREEARDSVHSSHRYHPSILKDVAQVLSSVDRSMIDTREPHDSVKDVVAAPTNHFQLK